MTLLPLIRGAIIMAACISMGTPRARAEQGDDLFQRGVQAFQSGDKGGAVKLFTAAARAGNSKAAVQAGWSYEYGSGVPQNLAEAARWYQKAADGGNSRGQKNLGAMYEGGRGVPEDWIEAAKWYQKSAAQNDADGEAALARAYQFGIGVPQSRSNALFWNRKAAALGDADAAYFVRWLSNPTNNIWVSQRHRKKRCGRLSNSGRHRQE